MKGFLLILVWSLIVFDGLGQRYIVEKSTVNFFSDATIEDISAENTKANSIINTQAGDIAFSIAMREFQFEKKLMQEHFNEKYLESEKFPKATFSGKMIGFDQASKGIQQVRATGRLTIHGVTANVDIPGAIEVQTTKLVLKSRFIVKLADYNIKIPQLMWQNIAEQVEVTLNFTYQPQ